nr:hypothetical protein CFP56_13029 [Quercus suber]
MLHSSSAFMRQRQAMPSPACDRMSNAPRRKCLFSGPHDTDTSNDQDVSRWLELAFLTLMAAEQKMCEARGYGYLESLSSGYTEKCVHWSSACHSPRLVPTVHKSTQANPAYLTIRTLEERRLLYIPQTKRGDSRGSACWSRERGEETRSNSKKSQHKRREHNSVRPICKSSGIFEEDCRDCFRRYSSLRPEHHDSK